MSSTNVRVLSAAALLLSIILIYFLADKPGLLALAFIISLGCSHEFARLCFSKSLHYIKYIFILNSLLIFSAYVFNKDFIVLAISFSFIFSCAFFLVFHKKESTLIEIQKNIFSYISGIFYVGLLPAMMTKLVVFHDSGLSFLIIGLATVFSVDISAYFIGRKFGNIKLSPVISPNKTRAGALAGLITGSLICCLTSILFGFYTEWLSFLVLGLIVSVFSQIGDLFESILKRVAGQKDSGNVLPGHGGYLDRLDSILFSFPFFYLYAYYIL